MPGFPNNLALRWLVRCGISLIPCLAALWALVGGSSWGDSLVEASYDSLFRLTARWQPRLEQSPVTIIYLDLPSYQSQKQSLNKPWDRGLHARLLRRLKEAGARAVVFDILFNEPGPDPAADLELAEAIRQQGAVVLGAEVSKPSSRSAVGDGSLSVVVDAPAPMFLKAAAGWGLAESTVDDDFVVRQHFPGFLRSDQPSVVWRVGRLLGLPTARTVEQAAEERWLRYYGPPLSIPHVSYDSALQPATDPGLFRDKVVFVGAQPMAGAFGERRDELRSPFRKWNDRDLFMPGVEVHATEMLNLIRGDWLRRLPGDIEIGILLVTGLLSVWGLRWLRPVPATFLAVGAEGLVVAVAMGGFLLQRHWFPWLLVSGLQIPLGLGISILAHSVEWYRTKRRMEAERRVAEEKIREQAALIDKAQDAILVRDLQGGVLYANPSAERLYGWSLRELQAGVAGIGPMDWQDPGILQARLATERSGEWVGELAQRTSRGRELLVQSRWTLIRDAGGAPRSFLLILTDITERRRLETQVLQAQRMETIGALAGGMAHDLNNALSPILMGVQILRRKPQDPESQQMLSMLETNCHRGADIVRQVLLFARGRDGEQQRILPGQLLREMEQVVRQTFPRGLRVSVMAPSDLWPVRGNPTQIHQVLLNLCVNARDAMSEGGDLTLAADNATVSADEAARIPNATPGEYVVILVADTGTGIAPEDMPKVFEPFFTTKPVGQGTGLGLPTVSRIVRQHRGFIDVKSEVGVGTTFEIYLPREAAAEAGSEESREVLPAPARGHGELLLVVDDEQAVAQMIRSTLVEQGYRVECAVSGEEGLALLDQHRGGVGLMLLDWQAPAAGEEPALQRIRARHPSLPVVLMSGGVEGDPAAVAARESGAGLLAKPFGAAQLLAAVAGVFRR